MTEIYHGPLDPLYGDVRPKVVDPLDPYHKLYPETGGGKSNIEPIKEEAGLRDATDHYRFGPNKGNNPCGFP